MSLRRRGSQPAFRPTLESLEERTVPSGAPITFLVDSAHSSVSVTGTANLPVLDNVKLLAQGSHALTTAISGSIKATLDLAAHRIDFVGSGSKLTLTAGGKWAPKASGAAGSSAANFGFNLGSTSNGQAAIRGTVLAIAPGSIKLGGSSVSLSAKRSTFAVKAGAVDYRLSNPAVAFFPPGTADLASGNSLLTNTSHTAGKLQDLGSHRYKLTVPFKLAVNTNIATGATPMTWTGTLVATFDPNKVTPSIATANAAIFEGDFGTPKLQFHVSLSSLSNKTITLSYATAAVSGGATSGVDFVPAKGTLTFKPGVTSLTIAVAIKPDTIKERDEKFDLKLSKPKNATLANTIAVGLIRNDDGIRL